MRVLDEAGNDIIDPDEELGRLIPERLLVSEAIPYKPAKVERVLAWENGERKLYKREQVEPEQRPVPAVYEDILRYVPYTEAELAEIAARKEAEEQARAEAEAEAKRQAELQERIEALPDQVEALNEAVAEAGAVIGENDDALAALRGDVSDLMEAVAEIGTLVAGE